MYWVYIWLSFAKLNGKAQYMSGQTGREVQEKGVHWLDRGKLDPNWQGPQLLPQLSQDTSCQENWEQVFVVFYKDKKTKKNSVTHSLMESGVSFALPDFLIWKLTEKLLAHSFLEPCTLQVIALSQCNGVIALFQTQLATRGNKIWHMWLSCICTFQ